MNDLTRADSPIPFINVAAQRARLGSRIDDAVLRVVDHCQFILGPEVFEVEKQLAAYCGVRHAISVASGTDALILALMAKGIRPNDAVFCPSFTFTATAESIAMGGGTPVFVDVDESTFNIDATSLERAITTALRLDLKPKAVMAVDLFGLPADHDRVGSVADKHGIVVIDDAAQSFGATYHNRRVGALSEVSATSFFPAKPLGCYGDGGAVFTDQDDIAALVRSLRNHGAGTDRYDNVCIGLNSRLDTIQAAVLIEKLKIFPEEIEARNRVAKRYAAQLGDIVTTPRVPEGHSSVWAQYTVRVPAHVRDSLAAALREQGIPTAIYYAKPTHRQTAYRHYPVVDGGLPVTDRLAGEVISLPMHAYLDEQIQDRIVAAVRSTLGRSNRASSN